MKILRAAFIDFFLLFSSPLLAFAHETEVPHEEAVPTIDPLFVVGGIVVVAVGGFFLWKFVLQKKPSLPLKVSQPPSSSEKKVV